MKSARSFGHWGKYVIIAVCGPYLSAPLLAGIPQVYLVIAGLFLVALLVQAARGQLDPFIQPMRSREFQKGLYFTVFWNGLWILMWCYMFLFMKPYEPPQIVRLADLEAGKVKASARLLRLVGPLDCRYDQGVPLRSKKNHDLVLGWFYPVVSSQSSAFNSTAAMTSREKSMAIYFYEDGCKGGNHQVIPEAYSFSQSDSRDLEGVLPLAVFRRAQSVDDRHIDPPSDFNFYLACTMIAAGLAMFIGTCLRPAVACPHDDD